MDKTFHPKNVSAIIKVTFPDSENWWTPLLRCPDCGAALVVRDQAHHCLDGCGWNGKDWRDLLCQNPRPCVLTHRRKPSLEPEKWLQELITEPPERFYNGPAAQRDSTEFLSILQNKLRPGDAVLDLGCGPRDQALPLQSLGLRYLGVDVDSAAADLLVDGHALPFVDHSFEAVFSFAVLEHLRDPLMGLVEVARVLKPGGCYVGTVSLGEPFHASYFHHTPWGLLALLQQVPELHPVRLWSTRDTLHALAKMGRYPRVIRQGLQAITTLHEKLPLLAPRRMQWQPKQRQIDSLYRAGSIGFLIKKAI